MKKILFLVAFFAAIAAASAQNLNLNSKGVGILGYDPVSYFKGTPKKGNAAITAKQGKATYYFETAENQKAFNDNPTKYEPQYGGWCAYAMGSTGELVSINPLTYKILNGKLYLFYNSWGNNTLTSWNKDEQRLLKQADQNYLRYK
jgi:YHS domain-containing protein